MKSQNPMEKKLADWESAFYSMKDLRGNENLKGLIESLRAKIRAVSPGVA